MGKPAKVARVRKKCECGAPAGESGACGDCQALEQERERAAEKAEGAPARFAAFLAERDLTNVKAGELFDCAPSYITMLRRGQVTPGLDLAARIEKHTGIECKAWVA